MDFECKKVENGYIVTVLDTQSEYIFQTYRQVLKFIKGLLEGKEN